MEGSDRFIISPAVALWLGTIAGGGRGNRSDRRGEYIFTMDSFFDASFWFNTTFFNYGKSGDPQTVLSKIRSGWYT